MAGRHPAAFRTRKTFFGFTGALQPLKISQEFLFPTLHSRYVEFFLVLELSRGNHTKQ